MTLYGAIAIFLVAYLVLLLISAQREDLKLDDPDSELLVLPKPGEVALTGLYFLLPITVLLWCILIERLSPALSAFWASMAMIFVVLTQHPLKAMMRQGQPDNPGIGKSAKRGVDDFVRGMIGGASSMVPIGVATGVAGIIIGTVSLTGAHQVVGEFVEFLSGGSLIAMLALVAVMSLLLGMGLPTTANYIVVSSLMAPVIISVGAQQGLVVPLVAVHMFVFYFGILADDTPPVGLAAFAASAISDGDPIKTGLQGFAYDIRTALLPFLFIFNTELLLIDVSLAKAVFIFLVGVIAMMLFAAATQGYFFAKSRIWESVLLLLVAFTLFRPGFWLDKVQPPFELQAGSSLIEMAEQHPVGEPLRLRVKGPDFDDPDKITQITLLADLGEAADGETRLEHAGLTVILDGDEMQLEEPFAGTKFFQTLQMFDFYADPLVVVDQVLIPAKRIAKEVFYIPALLVLGLVVLMQRRRQTKPAFFGNFNEEPLVIDDNQVVSMHYRLNNGFGEEVDTSLGALPLVYMHNTNALLPALERELTGHVVGDQLEITIYPEDAYGYADEDLVQELPKALLDPALELVVGMRIEAKDKDGKKTQLVSLKEIREDTVILDANHPLAGQVLHFHVAIVAVRKPTEQELLDGVAVAS